MTWQEFVNFLVSKECSFFENGGYQQFHQNLEIDHVVFDAMMKVIENEIYNLKELEKLKR